MTGRVHHEKDTGLAATPRRQPQRIGQTGNGNKARRPHGDDLHQLDRCAWHLTGYHRGREGTRRHDRRTQHTVGHRTLCAKKEDSTDCMTRSVSFSLTHLPFLIPRNVQRSEGKDKGRPRGVLSLWPQTPQSVASKICCLRVNANTFWTWHKHESPAFFYPF